MAIRHRPYSELCRSTGSELANHPATDHETRPQGRARAEVVPAGAVAER